MSSKKTQQSSKTPRSDWAWVFQKIAVLAINKGVVLPVGLMATIIIWSFRLEPKDLSERIKDFFNLLSEGWIIGWVLSAVFLVCWAIHVKTQRRINENELKRVTEERNQLQDKLTGRKIESSGKKEVKL